MTEIITADKRLNMDTYINYGEAMEESERLKKVTGNPHTVVREDCDCGYHPLCGRCGGEGGYYEIVEQTVLKTENAPIKSCREMEIEQNESEAA